MRKELHKVLSDNVPEVEGRVFPVIMPQDMKRNSIVYHKMGNYDTRSVTCSEPVATVGYFQIDVMAKTYGESVDIMEKVVAALRANFIVSELQNFELYENITLKYRQVIDVHLEQKPVFSHPTPPQPTRAFSSGFNKGFA